MVLVKAIWQGTHDVIPGHAIILQAAAGLPNRTHSERIARLCHLVRFKAQALMNYIESNWQTPDMFTSIEFEALVAEAFPPDTTVSMHAFSRYAHVSCSCAACDVRHCNPCNSQRRNPCNSQRRTSEPLPQIQPQPQSQPQPQPQLAADVHEDEEEGLDDMMDEDEDEDEEHSDSGEDEDRAAALAPPSRKRRKHSHQSTLAPPSRKRRKHSHQSTGASGAVVSGASDDAACYVPIYPDIVARCRPIYPGKVATS